MNPLSSPSWPKSWQRCGRLNLKKSLQPRPLTRPGFLVGSCKVISTLGTAEILAPIQGDLQAVEAKLRESVLADQHPALTSSLDHLLASGGKRVRPAVTLLSARLFGAPRGR